MTAEPGPFWAMFWRVFSWSMVALVFAFIGNAILTQVFGWAGPGFSGTQSLIQSLIYVLALAFAWFQFARNRELPLRADAMRISDISYFIIRAAFWTVLLVGAVDFIISLLRVEGILPSLIGDDLTRQLGLSRFRTPWVHAPLIVISIIIAWFTRSVSVVWLSLLVVAAELLIVFTRFVFSYEQAFMGDLVRFWYAALFLFSSAYTLMEEGHVRVDVLYSGFSDRTKGLMNAIGCVAFGMTLCWATLLLGMATKSSIISGPVISLEVTQSGFGMYVKYLMAAFLGVFAVSMLLQFSAYLLEAIADWRGEPGKRVVAAPEAH